PWKAGTLEWAVPFPVPQFNFGSVPEVDGRYPLWDRPETDGATDRTDGLLGKPGDGRRELLGTGILSAKPEQVIRVSTSTWIPLLACFRAKRYRGGARRAVPLRAVFGVWAWTSGHRQAPVQHEAKPGLVLPTQYATRNAPGWWALVTSLLIDGALFASLVFAYFYLWLGTEAWPPAGIEIGALGLPLVALALLAGCMVAAQWAWRALLRGDSNDDAAAGRERGAGGVGWLAAALLGAGFIAA